MRPHQSMWSSHLAFGQVCQSMSDSESSSSRAFRWSESSMEILEGARIFDRWRASPSEAANPKVDVKDIRRTRVETDSLRFSASSSCSSTSPSSAWLGTYMDRRKYRDEGTRILCNLPVPDVWMIWLKMVLDIYSWTFLSDAVQPQLVQHQL